MDSGKAPHEAPEQETIPRYGLAVPVALVPAILSGVGTPSAFDTFGPDAARLTDLWWLMFWMAVPIYLATMAILVVAVVRSRSRDTILDPREVRYSSLLVGGGVVVPLLVIIPLIYSTVVVGNDISSGDEGDHLLIEVTGHQWWWEINYPDSNVVTANEMHIPIDRDIKLELTSEDVIHSFWVPQLQGKLDLIPGTTNTLWIDADRTGTMRGLCAEHCGIQHTNMRFLVVAHEEEEFNAWLEEQQQPAADPESDLARTGQQVFEASSCASCHHVQGHSEASVSEPAAPDLTHLASREEIAAGTLPNTRGNLGGWILNPQNVKPGTQMPPTTMDADEFEALLAYLQSLE